MKESTRRKILGLTSAKLYGVKAYGQLTVPTGNPKRGVYYPVPESYESLIPESLKRLMEFPGFTAAEDDLTKLRKQYLAMGGQRSNTRYGWIRTDT